MVRYAPPCLMLSLLLCAGAGGQTAPANNPSALPATADIQKQIDDAQYRDALRNVLRVLDLRGSAAAPYERPEIMLLEAECQLQLRNTQAAQDALNAAVKEARGTPASPTPHPDVASRAWALSALITKSPGMLYTPKLHTGPIAPKPISILDRALRPAAFKALFDDSLADVKAKVRAAVAAGNMPPILDAAKSVSALRALEKAGTGGQVESDGLAADLTTRAATLLSVALGDMQSTADAIAQGANLIYTVPMEQVDMVTGTRAIVQVPRRRGLVNDEAARLKGLQQTCGQISSACVDLNLALDAAGTFAPLASQAEGLAQRAGNLLGDDYTRPPH